MRGALLKVGVVLVLGLLGPSVAAAQDPDLAGEWHLNSITGGTTADTSGHGDNGTIGGTPTSVADGRFGAGVHFPAKTAYISAGNVATLQPSNVSVLAWVRSSTTPGNVENIVAQGGQSGCSFASYAMYTGGSADNTPDKRGVRFYIYNGTTTIRTPPVPTTIWDGKWHAIVGTYDGSNVRIYADGQEVGAPVPASGAIGYNTDLTHDFWIGNFAGGSQCIEQTQFAGDIDEVRIWDRGLTAAEAAYVSSSTATTPPELPIPGPPPPPPANPPQNLVLPSIHPYVTPGGPTGSYICDKGSWKNVSSSGYTYRWIANENGKPVPIAQGWTLAPTSTIYGYPITCEVTVQGPTAPLSVASNPVYFTSAGFNTMPKAYGDVRVKGIDVWQVVQPNAGAQAYGYPSGTFTTYCGGGTPTAFVPIPRSFFCTAGNDPQNAMQKADYSGVKLDSDKKTVVSVYINTVVAQPGDPNIPINVELSGTSNGKSLGDPLVKQAPTPEASDLATVQADQRDNGADQVRFVLPSSWTEAGNVTFTAKVDFPKSDFGPTYGAYQCPDPNSPPGDTYQINQYPRPNCDTDDTFTLKNVPFEAFTYLPDFDSVQLLTSGQTGLNVTANQVEAAGKYLYPGGEHFGFYSYSPGSIDIDAASRYSADSKGNCMDQNGNSTGVNEGTGQPTRYCRWDAIDPLMAQWVTNNPARLVICGLGCVKLRMYDALVGVAHYSSGEAGVMVGCPTGSFCPEPGFQHPVGANITLVDKNNPDAAHTGYFVVDTSAHPVQGAAHELGHWLGLPHAGVGQTGCINSNPMETWPGDNIGRLQSTRYNPVKGWSAVPQVDGDPSGRVLYDLMTYCADFADRATTAAQRKGTINPAAYPGNAWLSARNWNHVLQDVEDFQKRVHLGSDRIASDVVARAARQAATPFAVGSAEPSGGWIARVVPSNGQNSVPASVPNSPYRLRSLGRGGRVLLDVGVTVQSNTDGGRAGTFVGRVAPGATSVQLVYAGRVLATKASSKPPHVKLTSPRRGIHLRRGQRLALRWKASDPDTKALQVTVDVTSDGKVWRSAYIGPNRGHLSLPSGALPASKRTRVRVTVNDGFSNATSVSPKLTTPGSPPQAQIIAPAVGGTVLAGQRTRLVGAAVNDRRQALKGRSLTWFAGRKRLGSGTTLRAKLPAGKVTLRLVARASGTSRTVTERLTVTAPKLRVIKLSVPQRVKKGAKTVTITLRTSATSKLTVGRRHYTVRTRTTRITLSLPAKPAVGLVKVPFTLSPTSRSVSGKIRGSVWVVRT